MSFTIGNYYPADSPLHRVDPRAKILGSLVLMVTLFLFSRPVAMLAYTLFLLVLVAVARIPLRLVLGTLRPILMLALIALIANILTGPEPWLWQRSFLRLSLPGLETGLTMALRLCLLILTTQLLLTLTTTPILIADGLEALFAPFTRFGFPAHELAMMMSIALRFVPTLAEEADKIMKAQSSRGADYDTGGVLARARGLISVLVPLFVSALKRADELATAMEARCYRGGEGRTKLRPLVFRRRDALFSLAVALVAAFVLTIEHLL
ncbi:MAG: energy-coupling factor transporter transmembrane component T [Bacillota bacterium]|nr:energy-coupling factor transporter transmembrane component T [Bacillota bacterium]